MMKKYLLAAMAFGVCSTASAAGSFDVRYANGILDMEDSVDEIETDRDGLDIRVQGDIDNSVYVTASYLATQSDDADINGVTYVGDIDLDVFRAGFGVQQPDGPARVYGKLEYARATIEIEGLGDETENGAVASLGVRGGSSSPVLWDAEVGYTKLSDSDGFTVAGNLGYAFSQSFAGVAGIQGYFLEDDADIEYDILHFSVGVRFLY